jgi:hypothetical protein
LRREQETCEMQVIKIMENFMFSDQSWTWKIEEAGKMRI